MNGVLARPRADELGVPGFRSWTAFAREADQKPGSQIAMAKMLQKRHLTPLRTSKFRGFTGIAIKDDDA